MGEAIMSLGGCVCVRVAFFVCQWALSTLHLPMSKHPLMPMDCAQSSVRASKSSTGERNSHQHKLPKEGANVPPINILKVSPMLSGNIAGWHAWVKITSLHHAEGRVGLPNVYIWFQKWWIQSLWHPISFLKQDLLLQWPQSRKKPNNCVTHERYFIDFGYAIKYISNNEWLQCRDALTVLDPF